MSRSLTFYQVGNGNACLVQVDGFSLLLDAGVSEDCPTIDYVMSMLPGTGKPKVLDAFCNSHGDKDHCGGFLRVQELVKSGQQVVGSIWHPNYDRTNVQDKDELPKSYLALRDEILRRRGDSSTGAGGLECVLTAWQDETEIPHFRSFPSDFSVQVLSPYRKDSDEDDWDVNDLSLVLCVEISGMRILFTGDISSEYWVERIQPHVCENETYQDWVKAHMLVASHHGSFSFFGPDREAVRDANPQPDNYLALDHIKPRILITSANKRFPLSGDSKNAQPPHYTAWKWYHKWFRDNRGVKEDDKHPSLFRYTADGHLRLEYRDGLWHWIDDWQPEDVETKSTQESNHFTYTGGTRRRDAEYA